jgi:hypothetical protein
MASDKASRKTAIKAYCAFSPTKSTNPDKYGVMMLVLTTSPAHAGRRFAAHTGTISGSS